MSSRAHSYFQDLLEKHISGAPLVPDDRFALFDHIETCDACRHMLEAEERLTARMKTVPRLVAPSDLRSKILSQAIRDHRERTTTPSEDPALVDVLVPQTPPIERKPQVSATVSPATLPDDYPVFAGITRPQPTRVRRLWRQASPVLATGFLTVASLGALYTGQFQGIPLAGHAQQVVWSLVDSAIGKAGAPEQPGSPISTSAYASGQIINLESEAMAAPPAVSFASLNDQPTKPFAGTDLLAVRIQDVRQWMAAADSTMAVLAKAAQAPVPGPAEDAAPQIAALVLRPTDAPGTRGGFQQSELAMALESMATNQPGAIMASRDQFATNGHRYRLYTLELPAGSTHRLVQTLNPYTAPEDVQIVSALASQDHITMGRDKKVRFFASDGNRLCTALEALGPMATSARQERVQVVVVE